MRRAFLDTNIIVENLVNLDFKNKYNDLSQKFIFVIHEAVILELGNLLKKHLGSRVASQIISLILENYEFYPQSLEDLKLGLAIMEKYDFKKPNKDYTLTDAILLACTEKEGFTLLSMDQEMGFYKFQQGEFLQIKS